MPVVIDDLDVEVEPSAPAERAGASAANAAPPVTANVVDDLVRQLAARRERVRAD